MPELEIIKHVASIVKGYALAIGVAYAIWYVWRWRRQTRAWRLNDQQAKAQNLWSAYLKTKLDFFQQPIDAEETQRGIDFVAYLLSVGNEILLINPNNDWRATLRDELGCYKPILKSDTFDRHLKDRYSPELSTLIEEAINGD